MTENRRSISDRPCAAHRPVAPAVRLFRIVRGGQRDQGHGKAEEDDLEHQDQRHGRIEDLPHHARVALQRPRRKTVDGEVGEDQRRDAADDGQHPHGEDAGHDARKVLAAQQVDALALHVVEHAGRAHLRERNAVGQGQAQRDEQGGRQRYQFQHQHAHHHFQRIARQAVALRADDDDAYQHQADERTGDAEPHQVGRRVRHQAVREDGAVVAVIARWRQGQRKHQDGEMQHAPPADQPGHGGPVQAAQADDEGDG